MEGTETAAESTSRIRVLPPELAEQIAAGEVVERPASVVKELVENALDAGARRIEVTVEQGGRKLIRVVDDGSGMTPEEAALAIKRHATSKLRTADDLWRLETFGFRGEALPSIASVSRLALATKTTGSLAGYRLEIEAGRVGEGREAGLPDGTQIEVRDLFFNTPARLKFLKTEATESANVSESLLRLALANPGVHFKLRSNDRVVLDLPPARTYAERARAALGRRGAGALHEALGEENGVRVQAFVAGPEEASTTPRNTFLFVARRAVRDRSLLSALGMAYGELLERGRYPLAALFVDLPGTDVDVNVHPQKLEVRFARAQEVYAAVRHVVGAAIARAPWLQATPVRTYTMPPGQGPAPEDRPRQNDLGPLTNAGGGWSLAAAARAAARGGPAAASRPLFPPISRAADAPAPTAAEAVAPRPETSAGTFFGALAYIGQLARTYLVCEGPGELVLVDQHAAHERVAFSRLRRAFRERSVARQRLLFPLEIEVDESAVATAESPAVASTLAGLGFELDGFGGKRLVLRAVPELLKDADPKPLLLDLLHGLAREEDAGARATLAEEALDHLFATLACHSVKRAGDSVTREEAAALLAQLDEVDLRSHCPHGRPVLVRLPIGELERRFGRT
jgi:DNA mismatch repair protein MutL